MQKPESESLQAHRRVKERISRQSQKSGNPRPIIENANTNGVDKESVLESWERPIPLYRTISADPFPVEVLPPSMGKLVSDISSAINCSRDMVGVTLLTLAGGAIGNARHLAITESHIVSPCLYAVVVAPPGAAKSPPLRLLRQPFDCAECDYRMQWRESLDEWKGQGKDSRDVKPILRRCVVSNVTTESLQCILDENPRGILMIRNELSGLVAGLNQYKNGGDDRQFYLDLWDGTPIVTDRKSDRQREGVPLFVKDAFTAIIGTIQPDVISIMRQDAGRRRTYNDGFLDRFLFAYPENIPAVGEQWREVPSSSLAAWNDAVRALLSLQMLEGEPPRPHLLRLDGEGKRAWQSFTEEVAADLNSDQFPNHLKGPWVKLRAYGARLALILRCLRWACNQTPGEAVDELCEVDGESMEGAASLIRFFQSHARKVYAALGTDLRHAEAVRALKWLGNSLKSLKSLNGFRIIKRSDLHAGVWGGSLEVNSVSDIISLLMDHGYLRLQYNEIRKGPGRKPCPVYEIHPSVSDADSDNSDYSENYQTREPGEEG